MLRKSLFNVSLVSFGNIFNSILGFIFLTTVAKVLSVETFGKYALITSLLVAVAKIIDFGSNSVYVAKAIKTETQASTEYFVSLKLLLFLVTLPVSLLALYILGLLNYTNLTFFIVGLVGYGINQTLYALFQKSEQFVLTFLINTIPGLIKAVFGILSVLNFIRIDFELAFGVFAVSILTSVFFYAYIPYKLTDTKLNISESIKLIKESIAAGLSQLIGVGWNAIANSMLSLARSLTDVGIYSLANKIANIFSLISISVFTVLLPANARRVRDNKGYDFKETAVISILIIVMSFVALILGKTFINVFFGQKFAASLPILNILIISYSLNAISNFLSNYFYVNEKTNHLLFITVTTLIIFVVSGGILIPKFATMGIAIAQLTSSIVSIILPIPIIYATEKKNRS